MSVRLNYICKVDLCRGCVYPSQIIMTRCHLVPCTQFGVEIRLSQFTLTKLVIVTPYYLLVNETKVLYMHLFFYHVQYIK